MDAPTKDERLYPVWWRVLLRGPKPLPVGSLTPVRQSWTVRTRTARVRRVTLAGPRPPVALLDGLSV